MQMAQCNALDEFSRARSQANFYSARIERTSALGDESVRLATLDQRDGALMARVEASCQFAYGCPLTPVEPAEMEQ